MFMGRHRLRNAALLVVLSTVVVGGWLAFQAAQIRSHLAAARSELAGISVADIGRVPQAAEAATREVQAAQSASHDPLWRAAAAIPYLGRSFAVARDATDAVAIVVDETFPPALRAADTLSEGAIFARGRVDLDLLAGVGADIGKASTAATRADRLARRTNADGIPAPLRRQRDLLLEQTARLSQTLASADTTLRLAPGMLGADGPRRYFVAVQNNAETRGPGGLIGAYALVKADRGALTRQAVGTDGDFRSAAPPVKAPDAEYAARYGPLGGLRTWSAAVATPDWPSASQVIAELWQAQGGGQIDGVIGLDPLSMARILAVTGPTTVEGREIGADNVADFVMRDEYALFEDESAERKRVLAELAEGLYDKVVAGGFSASDMVQSLAAAGRSGHLKLWSAVPSEQAVLTPLRASGALPSNPGPYLQVVMNNGAGNKIDYYLRRSVKYVRRADGTADVTITFTNLVEPAKVPPIVIGRLDNDGAGDPLGTTRQVVSTYLGTDQEVLAVGLDGKPAPLNLGSEKGHPVATVILEIAPKKATTLSLRVSDPGGELTYRQQPLVVDDDLSFKVPFRLG